LTIQQSSENAIINISGEHWEERLEGDGLKLLTPSENPQTFIRVHSDKPIHLPANLSLQQITSNIASKPCPQNCPWTGLFRVRIILP